MLHRAHSLCDEEEGQKDDEVKLLGHAFFLVATLQERLTELLAHMCLVNRTMTEKLNIELIQCAFHL